MNRRNCWAPRTRSKMSSMSSTMRFGTARNEPQYCSTSAGARRSSARRSGQVFQPRDGRLRAQILARGQTIERQFEHPVAAQRVGVVAVLIAGSDHQHAKPDDFGQAMRDLLRRPRVLEIPGQPVGQSQPGFDLAQATNRPPRIAGRRQNELPRPCLAPVTDRGERA